MFKILDKTFDFQNKEYVYPSKQEECFKFIQKVKDYCNKIILFGSSVTMHCRPDSDLDFAILLKDKKFIDSVYKATNNLKSDCDLIWLEESNISPELQKNISKGIVIYG